MSKEVFWAVLSALIVKDFITTLVDYIIVLRASHDVTPTKSEPEIIYPDNKFWRK